MTLSIVTPWRDAPELMDDYESATAGAHLVIVDHLSNADNAGRLRDLCRRAGGFYLRDDGPWDFARLNNRGLRRATGDVVLFMNNDIRAARPWLAQAERDCLSAAVLCGPSVKMRQVGTRSLLYLEGWCIGARRSVWDALKGWDESYTGGYWEDNDLCYRATLAGYGMRRCTWPLTHKDNYTSKQTAGAYAHSEANQARFERTVEDA